MRGEELGNENRQILKGIIWVAVFLFVGKLAAAAKEMAIAYRFGISEEVDAYLFVFNLVTWPAAVWFSVLTMVLVPLMAHIRQKTPDQLQHFRAELLGFTLIVSCVISPMIWVGLRQLLTSSWTGLPSTTATHSFNMLPILVLVAPLGMLIGLFSVWLLASQRHVNTLLESVPPLTILLALLALPSHGVEVLVWGTLAGFIFQLVSLAAHLRRRHEIEAPRFHRQSAQWPAFWQGFGIMLAGQALMSLITIIDQFFAAHLGPGAIATLGYATRILGLILGMGAVAVSRATLPVFSAVHAQGGLRVQRLAVHWAFLLFAAGLLGTILGWWLAPWLVRILFERGAFTVRDTEIVAQVFRYGILQLPFYFAGLVMVSQLVNQGRYRITFAIASLNLPVKASVNAVAVPYFGVAGLMIGTSVMLAFSCLLLSVAVLKPSPSGSSRNRP